MSYSRGVHVLMASMSALVIINVKKLCGQTLANDTRLAFGPHLCIGLLVTSLAMAYDRL
jgi:prepilin signal peptidase PulO-like enzyme (type II secretory pathway)